MITVGFGDERTDAAAKQRIEGYFPGRDVFVVEMIESWYDGGGVLSAAMGMKRFTCSNRTSSRINSCCRSGRRRPDRLH